MLELMRKHDGALVVVSEGTGFVAEPASFPTEGAFVSTGGPMGGVQVRESTAEIAEKLRASADEARFFQIYASCYLHVLGDPHQEGSDPGILAGNLARDIIAAYNERKA